MQHELIAAIATAHGSAGIGIIRLSGEGSVELVDAMFRPFGKTSLASADSRRALYGHIVREDGSTVDEALVLKMCAPHSYTCEDVVEIQSHGGSVVLREILAIVLDSGARLAEAGEFTKRAFLNGRLDLSAADAVMDVITAPTRASLHMAEGKLAGHFGQKIHALREELMTLIAHLEVVIDFPEDGVEELTDEEVTGKLEHIHAVLETMCRTFHTGRILKEGLPVAIIGRPNVGKSSLLNMLLGEDRAIVTDVEGTTRDALEEMTELGGIPLRIIDTAGIRATEDIVEAIGIERAREHAEKAVLLLALFDTSRPLTQDDRDILTMTEGKETICLLNKSDLDSRWDASDLLEWTGGKRVLTISTKTGEGIDALTHAVTELTYRDNLPDDTVGFISDARTEALIKKAKTHIEAVKRDFQSMAEDFLIIDLRGALEALGEVTGETVSEDVLNEIFSRFCIGK
ncbi:tRNA uridine-5-carboxymethylaminomethyl(34) synthesis GTPase MnmE [Selenomonas sp. TAMA-11512]|uniref:tRNA uridine-5-carboxymethylaminomethyl(34) synthesis GTPase MnmE n=1 Tax=Selenomonas sp. TAMA-11512 TaxID=3095337 RepID=UPI00308CD778|nr:tRNA uridine-5-carboxymethylaminomethyl(34) synthesis GTPase MnmE [Selenomonas sp. TAMA-11512]